MVALLHGAAGGLDEIAVGVVALGVLWIAVRLAGRKPAADEEQAAAADEEGQPPMANEDQEGPTNPTPKMKSN